MASEQRIIDAGDRSPAPQASELAFVLTAVHQAPLGIAIFDRQMRYITASRQFLTDQGLDGETPLEGRLHYDVFPDIPQQWRDLHARVLNEGVELSAEADPFERADGRRTWIRWKLAPWRTDAGEIGGLVLYTEVVTDKVLAQIERDAAEARHMAVFNHAAVGAARVGIDGRFLEVNDRLCAITGYSRSGLLKIKFQDITHPDDLAADISQVVALLRGDTPTFSMEKRYITKAGGTVWVNLTVALMRDAHGKPDYFISIVEDIGARKAVEADQLHYQQQLRLLINELNHRVKNTLATVQSMAAQTLRGRTDPNAAYEAFEARLMGLAEVHDVLTRESWHGAALQEVAERALKPFAGLASGHFEVGGPPVWLQPNAALTMALVFHELATNAVKYGALSVESGRVELAWRVEDERLHLSWTETGGPRVRKPPERKGFGSRLIERALRGDLRGSAVMEWRPEGLAVVMDARLPPLAAPVVPGA